MYNSDSDVRTEIHGNVTANSDVYGVGLNLHSTAGEASATTGVVDGDLFGSSYGMLVEQTDAQKQRRSSWTGPLQAVTRASC